MSSPEIYELAVALSLEVRAIDLQRRGLAGPRAEVPRVTFEELPHEIQQHWIDVATAVTRLHVAAPPPETDWRQYAHDYLNDPEAMQRRRREAVDG